MLYCCEKATELQEKSLLVRLNIQERIGLKFHLALCKSCRLYVRQSVLIEKGLERLFSKEIETPQSLSAQAKERILKSLEE
jgi:hypothetical protein